MKGRKEGRAGCQQGMRRIRHAERRQAWQERRLNSWAAAEMLAAEMTETVNSSLEEVGEQAGNAAIPDMPPFPATAQAANLAPPQPAQPAGTHPPAPHTIHATPVRPASLQQPRSSSIITHMAHVTDANQGLAQLIIVLVVQRDTDEQLDLAVHALQAQRVAVHTKVTRVLQGQDREETQGGMHSIDRAMQKVPAGTRQDRELMLGFLPSLAVAGCCKKQATGARRGHHTARWRCLLPRSRRPGRPVPPCAPL